MATRRPPARPEPPEPRPSAGERPEPRRPNGSLTLHTGAAVGQVGFRPLASSPVRVADSHHGDHPAALVGRAVELAEVRALLDDYSLVTLTGAPGVGKSALAAHVAAGAGFGRRAVAVSLAGVAPSSVPDVLATVGERLCERDAQGESPTLLVLDDADPIVFSGCAPQLGEIASRTTVLATSRVALGAAREKVWRVPSLSVPYPGDEDDPDALCGVEAVQLFCRRAAAAYPRFALTDSNAAPVAEICRRLDGIPLAIELAAARADELSPVQILAALDSPFTLLVDERRDRAARHRSLLSALKESTDLLVGAERRLWRRLSVFPAGFTAEAAAEVCDVGDLVLAAPESGAESDVVTPLLDRLVARSLVIADSEGESCRFRMLESVRRLAWDALDLAGEVDAFSALHAAWCARAIRRAGDPRRLGWLETLSGEAESIESALGWATAAEEAETAICLGAAHVLLCRFAGRDHDARAWLKPLLALVPQAQRATHSAALCEIGLAAGLAGEYDIAVSALERSVVVAHADGDPTAEVVALKTAGFVRMLSGDYDAGLEALDRGVALARTIEEPVELAETLACAARAHVLVGDPTTGRRWFHQSYEIARRAGDEFAVSSALVGVGWAALVKGDEAQAHAVLELALTTARRAGDTPSAAMALAWTGDLARRRGRNDQACAHYHEAETLARESRAPFALGRSLLGLGRLALAESVVGEARERFAEARDVGLRAAIPYVTAPALRGLGEVARAEGDIDAARCLLEEALGVARECADKAEVAAATAALASLPSLSPVAT